MALPTGVLQCKNPPLIGIDQDLEACRLENAIHPAGWGRITWGSQTFRQDNGRHVGRASWLRV